MDTKTQQRSATGCQLIADVVHSFGEVRLKVTGSSMIPAIWPGDVVVVSQFDVAELQAGQIVLFKREERLLAHRIVSIHGNSFITRGDTLCNYDPPVGKSQIVGRVVSIVGNGRCVHLSRSKCQRVFSEILRRSNFCMRMTLHLRQGFWRAANREMRWAS
jgi:signal peptidase I